MNLSTVVNLMLEKVQQQAINPLWDNACLAYNACSATQSPLIQTFTISDKSAVRCGLKLHDLLKRQALRQVLLLPFQIKR